MTVAVAGRMQRYRKARLNVYLKQHEQAEARFKTDMVDFLFRQIRHVQGVVKQAGRKSPSGFRAAGEEIVVFAFHPRDWDEELKSIARPHIATSMLTGAYTEAALFRYVHTVALSPSLEEMVEESFKSVQQNAPGGQRAYRKIVRFALRAKAEVPGEQIPFPELQGGGSSHQFIDQVPTEHLGPAFYSQGLPENTQRAMEDRLKRVFEREDYWDGINDATKRDFERVIREGVTDELSPSKLSQHIADKLGGPIAEARAQRIVRTETTMAFNAGHLESMKGLSAEGLVEGKEWLAVIDDKTRMSHSELNETVVLMSEPFSVGGWDAEFPGDDMLPAEERVNCRCSVVSAYPDDMGKALADAEARMATEAPGGPIDVLDIVPDAQNAVTPPIQPLVSLETEIERDVRRAWRGVNERREELPTAFNYRMVDGDGGVTFNEHSQRMFETRYLDADGNGPRPHDIAMMTGAPDGSTVAIKPYYDGFMVKIENAELGVAARRKVNLERGVIENVDLKVAPGNHTGTQMLMREVEGARKFGIKQIEAVAEGSLDSGLNGYYSWARVGFDGVIPKVQRDLIRAGSGPIGVSKSVKKISELMKTKAGAEWWRIHGTRFEGHFNTHQRSTSSRVLRKYRDERFGATPAIPKPTKPTQIPEEGRGWTWSEEAKNLTVRVDDGAYDLDGIVREMGMPEGTTLEQIASAAGAPDGAAVEMSFYAGHIDVSVRHGELGMNASRTFIKQNDGALVLKNNSNFIRKAPKGTGTRVLYRQMKASQRLGVARLETVGAGYPGMSGPQGMNGYYTWPRLGYDADVHGGIYQSLRRAVVETADPDFRDAGQLLLNRPATEPLRLYDLMRDPTLRAWWRDEVGENTGMTFDLSPGSQSVSVLTKYHDAKFGPRPWAWDAKAKNVTIVQQKQKPFGIVVDNPSAAELAEDFRMTTIEMFARDDIELDDIASLAGVPDGGTATITVERHAKRFRVSLTSPDFDMETVRIIRLDDLGEVEVYNSLNIIRNAPKGTGTRILNRQMEMGQRLGVRKFKTQAAGSPSSSMNGYYTWPRLGYNVGLKTEGVEHYVLGELKDVVKRAKKYPKDWEDKKMFLDAAEELLGLEQPTMHDIMKNRGLREWWRDEHGTSIDLEFDLRSGSDSVKVLRGYHDAKYGPDIYKPVKKVPKTYLHGEAKSVAEAEEYCRSLRFAGEVDFGDITLEQANRIGKKLHELDNSDVLKGGKKFRIEGFTMEDGAAGGSFQMQKYGQGEAKLRIAGNFDEQVEWGIYKERNKYRKERKKWQGEAIKIENQIEEMREFAGNPKVIESLETRRDNINQMVESMNRTTADLKESVLARNSTRATTLEDALDHEFGHILQADLQSATNSHSKAVRATLSEIQERYDFRTDIEGMMYDVRANVFDVEAATGHGVEVSHYASANGAEYFAESLLMYRQTGKIPDKMLTRLFKQLEIKPLDASGA